MTTSNSLPGRTTRLSSLQPGFTASSSASTALSLSSTWYLGKTLSWVWMSSLRVATVGDGDGLATVADDDGLATVAGDDGDGDGATIRNDLPDTVVMVIICSLLLLVATRLFANTWITWILYDLV